MVCVFSHYKRGLLEWESWIAMVCVLFFSLVANHMLEEEEEEEEKGKDGGLRDTES